MHIGFGNIGKELLQRLKAFQPENIFIIQRSKGTKHLKSVDSQPSQDSQGSQHSQGSQDSQSSQYFQPSQGSQTSIHIGTNADYIKYAKYTDICFLCCSQNSDNMGMVNNEFIYSLRKGAVIVNVARVCMYIYTMYSV